MSRHHHNYWIIIVLLKLLILMSNNNVVVTGFSSPSKLLSPLIIKKKKTFHDNIKSSLSLTNNKNENSVIIQSKSSSAAAVAMMEASEFEIWSMNRLESMYQDSMISIKCPFFRRRASDILEGLDMILRFVLIRHKSVLNLPPLGCRTTQQQTSAAQKKNTNLSKEEIYTLLHNDWKTTTDKGYYVTGRLNTTIYREDCMFDGPDPDMPVYGLRKYMNAASQLFDYKQSYATLESLEETSNSNIFVANWKMKGVLSLPWKPTLPEWNGVTYYYLDDNNLIYKHEEHWPNTTVFEAFLQTILPSPVNI